MEINDDMVNKLADLAKLEFNDHDRIEIKKDLTNILAFVEKLQVVNTDNIEPLIYINEDVNVLRKDEVTSEITQKEALLNAPLKDSDYFKVPKVLGAE